MTDLSDLRSEVSAETVKQVSRLKRGTEPVLVSEVTFSVTWVMDPGYPRNSYGGPTPSSTELESVKLFGVELIGHMTHAQQEQMIRALQGEEATL